MSAIFSDLENKKILVTGGSRGIGQSICKELATQKAHLFFQHRKPLEQMSEVISELESLGATVTPVFFDLSDTATMKEAIQGLLKEHGAIEGLVNNAGLSKDKLLLRLSEEDLTQILDVNLKSAMMLTSFLARGFLRAQNASIVNVSSIVGLMGNVAQSAYAASKAGLIGFTKSVAKELASKDIRANAICPGFIRTAMTDSLDDGVKEAYLSNIPLKRFGEADEVAKLVCFLLSSSSNYITGETIKIDGGLYI